MLHIHGLSIMIPKYCFLIVEINKDIINLMTDPTNNTITTIITIYSMMSLLFVRLSDVPVVMRLSKGQHRNMSVLYWHFVRCKLFNLPIVLIALSAGPNDLTHTAPATLYSCAPAPCCEGYLLLCEAAGDKPMLFTQLQEREERNDGSLGSQ